MSNAEMMKLIIDIVIAIIGVILTNVVIPWIKSKTEEIKFKIGEEKFNDLTYIIEQTVRAAKQKLPEYANEEKKKYVLDRIIKKASEYGLEITEEEIDDLIEGIYNAVKEDSKHAVQ